MRQKLMREGRRNPEEGRSPFAFADLRSRTTKSKAEMLNSSKNKFRNHDSYYGDDGSFLFVCNLSLCFHLSHVIFQYKIQNYLY
ncbi:hypothetical protein D3C76_801390 [compost metagenome]